MYGAGTTQAIGRTFLVSHWCPTVVRFGIIEGRGNGVHLICIPTKGSVMDQDSLQNRLTLVVLRHFKGLSWKKCTRWIRNQDHGHGHAWLILFYTVIREKENNFTGLNPCRWSPATVPIHWASHLHKPKDQRAGQCQVGERSSCSMSRKMTSLSSLQPASRPPWPGPDGANFSRCQTIDPYSMVTSNQWHKRVCTCGEYRRVTWGGARSERCVCLSVFLWRFLASIFRGKLVN